ncbi:hypothetical protein [Gordonia sp. (in: high G+C Gram-positive bacteria)]|jgi:thiosulfate dehydrogenase [quinone] large subunit|uniref:hypothetical protein n=1 Tax=Gordonia sp. (in: high G+C Gram-positive bacteria) TaxID=84139 RepID=UPI001D29362F|nr:hypothetical protein [Gordonia sp. (in: high G+C Gram-positive bacteria)]MCB1295452.1 hypothetical protein [Gordonia sp. (in: high G+C Gram-positive bacteria)]HMS76264.1 hypothetical protein [Gordonia sp. (in: high G+C Gram-positive bacteria)]
MATVTSPVLNPSRTASRWYRGVAVLTGVVGLTLGVLWIRESWIKYHAGFGAADIHLVADGAAQNSRVPGFFQEFCAHVLGPNAGLFGLAMPALEMGLGIGFVTIVVATLADSRCSTALTRLVAGGSVFTLMTYWLSDQLIWEYPIMVLLSAFLLATASSRRR